MRHGGLAIPPKLLEVRLRKPYLLCRINAESRNMREIHDGTLLHTLHIDGQPDCLKLFPPEYQGTVPTPLAQQITDATLSGTLLAATYEYDSHCKRRSGSIIAFNPCDALERYVKTGATIWNIESPTVEVMTTKKRRHFTLHPSS